MQRKLGHSLFRLLTKNLTLPEFDLFNLQKKATARPPRKSPLHAVELIDVADFGRNPGNLRMLEFVPPLQGKAALPLVIVLHGCRQNARDFDDGTGWTALGKMHGFAVVFAEQKPVNNPNLCFNWFRPSQMRKDLGEIGSIHEMTVSVATRHPIDRSRVFVVGLSAGAAVANALLATYPTLFKGGAVVSGLPFGAARDVMTALSVMRRGVTHSSQEWGDMIREVSPTTSIWPSVSVWHGTADSTVAFSNGVASVTQWLDVNKLTETRGIVSEFDGGRRTAWLAANGSTAVEFYELDGFGHGMPVENSAKSKLPGNETEKYLLASSLPAAEHMISEWGLIEGSKSLFD